MLAPALSLVKWEFEKGDRTLGCAPKNGTIRGVLSPFSDLCPRTACSPASWRRPSMGGCPSMPRSHKLRPIVSRASRNAAQPAVPVRTAAGVPQVRTIDVSEQTVFDLSGEAAPADFGQPAMPAAAGGRGPLAMPGYGEPKAEPVPVWKAECGELWY